MDDVSGNIRRRQVKAMYIFQSGLVVLHYLVVRLFLN